MMRTCTPEQLEKLPDNENFFAYSNINSELRMRVRRKVLKFSTISKIQACFAEAFPDVAVVAYMILRDCNVYRNKETRFFSMTWTSLPGKIIFCKHQEPEVKSWRCKRAENGQKRG